MSAQENDLVLTHDSSEYISLRESRIREILEFCYRFTFSVFISAHLYDFLFSPIWMHGYIWSLNQHIDIDLSDKTSGVILDRQLGVVGLKGRLFHAVLSSCAVIVILWLAGFKTKKRVWELLAVSIVFGALCGFTRCVQMQYRLYAAIHESFYVYLNFFLIGFVMTCRRR